MPKKTIEHNGIKITVREATVLDGMRRGRLIGEGVEANTQESSPEMRIARVALWPACQAATEYVEGFDWPLTFEQFVELPEQLVDEWLGAVYQLNPHWQPQGEQTEEEKKAAE